MSVGTDTIVIASAIAGIVLSFLAIILRLLDRGARGQSGEIILSVAIFSLLWFVFIYLMVLTGFLVYIPNLYNKGIPLYYLTAPGFYFYVRLKLYPVSKIPKIWWLHLIPFVWGLIDVIPYMFLQQVEKQAFVEAVVKNSRLAFEHDYGLVDQKSHYLLKLVLALVYLTAQWRLLFHADATDYPFSVGLRVRLYGLTLLASLLVLLQISMILNLFFNQHQSGYILMDYNRLIWVSGAYLLLSIWLCLDPYFRRRQRRHNL